MSVASVLRVESRAFNGFAAPGLPTGTWFGQHFVVGDASGGFANVQLLFQIASAPLSARLYSLEQFCLQIGGAAITASVGAIRTLAMDMRVAGSTGTQFAERIWAFPLLEDGNGDGLGTPPADSRPGWYLGAPIGGGFASGIVGNVPNPGVGFSVTLTAQGYFWEPAARNADGGPIKPTNGLWI